MAQCQALRFALQMGWAGLSPADGLDSGLIIRSDNKNRADTDEYLPGPTRSICSLVHLGLYYRRPTLHDPDSKNQPRGDHGHISDNIIGSTDDNLQRGPLAASAHHLVGHTDDGPLQKKNKNVTLISDQCI